MSSILVVDDDVKLLEILNTTLTRNGHEVHVAENGGDALLHCDRAQPDMLVLDVKLPDMDGREVLQILNRRPGQGKPPTVFVSASTDPTVRDSVFEGGAADFLVKPFSLKEFNARVTRVLHTHKQACRLKERNEQLVTEVSQKQENYVAANRELKRQLLAMRTVFAVSQDLNQHLDAEEMINGLALTLVGELQVTSTAVFGLYRERDAHLNLIGVKGVERARMAKLSIPRDSEFSRQMTDLREPQKITRRKGGSWVGVLPDLRLAIFEYVTPMIVKSKLKGLVFTGPKLGGRDYSGPDLNMLRYVCNAAAIGMDNARLFRELQNTYLSTVKALVSIIEAKDSYTKGHTERVADYAVALGAKMKLSRKEIRDLAFGAVLHDIGKLHVYERVLNKPNKLTAEEWQELKRHPVIGATIIENMDFLVDTVPLVRHHHEHWDGTGYPDGLKGEAIPLGARIISVADSYDAMTTNRAYRQALDVGTALQHLREKAGSQFDPHAVYCFVELIETDGFKPRGARRKRRGQS